MELLEAMGAGKIHIATLSPLAYIVGHQRGWVEPRSVLEFRQEPRAIMFVARKDSGLEPGEAPEVFAQMAGKRPCWPEVTSSPAIAPVSDYILPAGLLAQNSIQTGPPVFIPSKPSKPGYGLFPPVLDAAVFLNKCDFTAIEAFPADDYLKYVPAELIKSGVASFEDWAEQMQVLYTTPPIIPNYLMGISATLSAEVRDELVKGIMATSPPFEDWKFRAFDETDYDEFGKIVAASGLALEKFLQLSPFATEETPSLAKEWIAPPAGTVVIDVLPDGATPFLPGSERASFTKRLVLPAIYAELVRLDAEGKYFPYLAAVLPTLDNGLARFVGEGEDRYFEVEFQLRPSLRWQDGQPLTADDLLFSWELVMNPDWPFEHWGIEGLAAEVYVDSVEAPAPDRVVYHFMSQRQARQAARDGGRLGDPALYADLAEQVGPVVSLDYLEVGRNVFPKHLLEDIPAGEIAESDFSRRPVYAGAYRLVEGGEADQPVVLEAWDGFVLGIPKIERIVFGAGYYSEAAEPYWQTPEMLFESLQAGAVQAQLSLPAVDSREAGIDPRAYDALAEEGLAQVIWSPRNVWGVLDFNLENPHLADLRVRQAIAHALDRQAIIEEALAGHGDLMRSYLPAWHPLYAGDAALLDYDYDPQQAQALLQEAGYDLSQFPAVHPTRGPLTLRLASMDVAPYPRQGTAESIKEQLAEIGIQVEVQFYEWQEFEGEDCSAIRNGRQFDLGMAGWVGGSYYPLWWVEHSTASWSIPTLENGCPFDKSNWSGWRNDRVDQIIPQLKDGRLALEQPELYRQLWAEHQALWVTGLPSLPLFNVQRPVVVVPDLIGVRPSPFAFGGGVEDTWNIFEWIYK